MFSTGRFFCFVLILCDCFTTYQYLPARRPELGEWDDLSFLLVVLFIESAKREDAIVDGMLYFQMSIEQKAAPYSLTAAEIVVIEFGGRSWVSEG
jgi:hypothetical protein